MASVVPDGNRIGDLLDINARVRPGKLCLIDGPVRMTYEEVAAHVQSLSKDLTQIGLKRGDIIAVQLPNWGATLLIHLAAARIGAVTALISIAYRSSEMERILGLIGPKAVVVPRSFKGFDFVQMVESASPSPGLRCLAIDRQAHPGAWFRHSQIIGDEKHSDRESGWTGPGPEDPLAIYFTSGTEGEPKAALHNHRSILQMASALGNGMGLHSEDIGLVAAPMSAIAGIPASCLPLLAQGGTLVLQEFFDPEATLQMIQQEKISFLPASPAHLATLLSLPSFDSYDLRSVRIVRLGAAYAPPQLVTRIQERIRCRVVVGYGMTETGTLTLTSLGDSLEVICETVGRPVPGVVLRILDEQSQPLGVGQVGEIAIQGPSVFLGYLSTEGSLQTARDARGWFHTGEEGFLDAEGNLHFVGRRKEMINRGGTKVSPIEVEKMLLDHPKVKAVAVVGMPDERLGERACAYVVPQPGQEVGLEEIVAFLKRRGLAAYKLPERIEVVDDLPVSLTGKVLKEILRRDVTAKLEQEPKHSVR